MESHSLPGTQNSLADGLRHFATDHKWESPNSVLNNIFTQWQMPSWDLLTSQLNKKFNAYCSKGAQGKDSRINALLLFWTGTWGMPTTPEYTEDSTKQIIGHSNHTQLAQTILDSRSAVNVSPSTHQYSVLSRSENLEQQNQTSEPGLSSSHGLVFGWSSDLEWSWSKAVQSQQERFYQDISSQIKVFLYLGATKPVTECYF